MSEEKSVFKVSLYFICCKYFLQGYYPARITPCIINIQLSNIKFKFYRSNIAHEDPNTNFVNGSDALSMFLSIKNMKSVHKITNPTKINTHNKYQAAAERNICSQNEKKH